MSVNANQRRNFQPMPEGIGVDDLYRIDVAKNLDSAPDPTGDNVVRGEVDFPIQTEDNEVFVCIGYDFRSPTSALTGILDNITVDGDQDIRIFKRWDVAIPPVSDPVTDDEIPEEILASSAWWLYYLTSSTNGQAYLHSDQEYALVPTPQRPTVMPFGEGHFAAYVSTSSNSTSFGEGRHSLTGYVTEVDDELMTTWLRRFR